MYFEEVDPPRSGADRWMPYQTAGGVAFYPDRIPPVCLKCGAANPPWRKRTLRVGNRVGMNSMRIRSLPVTLPICGSCTTRWALAPWLAMLALAAPFLVFAVAFGLIRSGSDQLFGVVIMTALLSPIPLVALAWRWSLRVISIDDDGMIELRGVPRAVAAEIVDQASAVAPPAELPRAQIARNS